MLNTQHVNTKKMLKNENTQISQINTTNKDNKDKLYLNVKVVQKCLKKYNSNVHFYVRLRYVCMLHTSTPRYQ